MSRMVIVIYNQMFVVAELGFQLHWQLVNWGKWGMKAGWRTERHSEAHNFTFK
jgi:hypothetical protein